MYLYSINKFIYLIKVYYCKPIRRNSFIIFIQFIRLFYEHFYNLWNISRNKYWHNRDLPYKKFS